MSRLYEAKVDEKRWKIIETDNENYHTYKLIDKEKEEIYFLRHIIGVEQITEDEFLDALYAYLNNLEDVSAQFIDKMSNILENQDYHN